MAQMATLEKPENKELVGGKPTKSRKGGWYQCLNNAKIEETRDKLCRLAYKGDIEGLEALLRRESDNQSARALFSILNRPLKYVEDLPVQVKRKQLPSGSSCPANPPDPIQNVGACLLCFQIDLIWLWSEPYLFSQPHLYESKPWYRRMLGGSHGRPSFNSIEHRYSPQANPFITPLTCAIVARNVKAVEILCCRAGARPCPYLYTFAAWMGDPVIFRTLVECGGGREMHEKLQKRIAESGMTGTHKHHIHQNVVRAIANTKFLDRTIFEYALRWNGHKIADYLVNLGQLDLHKPFPRSTTTPLGLALSKCDRRTVGMLLKKDPTLACTLLPQPNEFNDSGGEKGLWRMLARIIPKRRNITKSKVGSPRNSSHKFSSSRCWTTPLHTAIEEFRVDLLRLLVLRYGANISEAEEGGRGRTPLHCAACLLSEYYNFESMFLFGTGPQKLVPPANTSAVTSTNRVRGSDDTMAVNSQDNVKGDEPENVEQDSDDDDDDDDIVDEFLKTPMFRRNISSVVPLCLNLMDNLLTWGADPSAVDVFGRTPLHLILQRAGSKGMEEAVQLLVRAGADVDAQEHSGGWSALHLAALYNQTRIVEYLIRMGAKLNQTTSRGVTELHLAARNGNR